MEQLTVKDIMTTDVTAVHPETPLVDVAKIMTDKKFNGIPVVDDNNILVGIITEYNLISNQSGIHLPTLQMILAQLPVFSKDKSEFTTEVAAVTKLIARDVMNTDPLTISSTASYDDAVRAFQDHHGVNPIPVIDPQRKLVGVISRYDVIKPLNRT